MPSLTNVLRSLLPPLLAVPIAALFPFPIATDPFVPFPSSHRCLRKSIDEPVTATASVIPTYATIFNLHTGELTPLSSDEPSLDRFANLLRCRTTGLTTPIAPRLLDLLRRVSRSDAPARIEVVSGFRHWKFNEHLRKKGHRVGSHSQHLLGNAIDFRIEGLTAKELATRVGINEWEGGLAFYPGDHDRFVHADVGPKRRWRGR